MNKNEKNYPVTRSDKEWKQLLSPFEYHVLREKGTERAFSGELNVEKRNGTFHCRGCGAPLFGSNAKYDSGSGWPSYFKPLAESAIEENEDRSFAMVRTEVQCARCGGHLGHLFSDGPEPTGMRYCINSASLSFEEEF